jgi:gamma-carbonic anhydrase
VAAGALVTPNKVVKSRQLWAGSPAQHVRDLTPEEIERNRAQTRRYAENAQRHRRQLLGLTA